MMQFFRRKKAEPIKAEKKRPLWGRVAEKAAEKESPRQPVAYMPPRGVVPENKLDAAKSLAQDAMRMANDAASYDYLSVQFDTFFPGYPYLANLAQLPEYRKMSEVPAKEMTRKWIRLTSTSDEDLSEQIAQLEDALEKYKIKDLFRRCAELDAQFGRGQLYIDVKKPDGVLARVDPVELELPLVYSASKITKGSLLGFTVVEPVWTYPGAYNADNPIAPDYYKPSTWFIMGKTVHKSRLLMFLSREVPDLLKAAYNFGGLSMSQMAKPYVDHWIRTRDAVSDIVHSFSTDGIKTDLSSILMGTDDAQFTLRAKAYTNMRDNNGLMMLDKDAEEFFQFNKPLGGLEGLQAQSQEQMASVSSIPLVKLLGITPSGLNASSDGEMQAFYDTIASLQEHIFRDNLLIVLKIIQLSEFGQIYEGIGFEFESLYGLDELEEANIRKVNADTDAINVSIGAISPDEVRQRLKTDDGSGYNSLDMDDEEEDDPLDSRANTLVASAKMRDE